MANRRFEQFSWGLEKMMVTLHAQWSVGSSGAPTLSKTKSKGIVSVTRNSAGNYALTLQDKYQYLAFSDVSLVIASGVPTTGSNTQCVVRADNSAAATPSIAIEFIKSDGTAQELVSGVVVQIMLKLKNSTV